MQTREDLISTLQNLPAEQIKQAVLKWLNEEEEFVPESLKEIVQGSEEPEPDLENTFSETASYQEWSQAFRAWVESHRGQNLPILSDEAISRESMYPDRT